MYLEPLPATAHASGVTVLDWSSVSRQPSQPLLPTSLGSNELRLVRTPGDAQYLLFSTCGWVQRDLGRGRKVLRSSTSNCVVN